MGLQPGTRQGRTGYSKKHKNYKTHFKSYLKYSVSQKNGQIIHVLNTKCFRWTDSDGRRLHQHNQYDFFIVDKLFSQVIVEKLF